MRRNGFTLIEVAIASVVTSMVAAAVIGTIQAVTDSTLALDSAAQSMARLARADGRVADHANRARLALMQNAQEVLLWLPTEPFANTANNTSDYDTIHGNELAWYVMDPSAGTLTLQCVENRNDRTTYGLSTNWAGLRSTLQAQSALTTTSILEGLASGGFRVEDSDACSVRRFSFDGILNDEQGGLHVQLGGRMPNGQRHPDCP